MLVCPVHLSTSSKDSRQQSLGTFADAGVGEADLLVGPHRASGQHQRVPTEAGAIPSGRRLRLSQRTRLPAAPTALETLEIRITFGADRGVHSFWRPIIDRDPWTSRYERPVPAVPDGASRRPDLLCRGGPAARPLRSDPRGRRSGTPDVPHYSFVPSGREDSSFRVDRATPWTAPGRPWSSGGECRCDGIAVWSQLAEGAAVHPGLATRPGTSVWTLADRLGVSFAHCSEHGGQ